MTDRRTREIRFGVVAVVVGLLLVWSGLTPLSQHRDADGYLLSGSLAIDRSSRAVVSRDLGLLRGQYQCAAEETWILGLSSPDDVRMQGRASGSGALFLGIAPADAVAGYLDAVSHDEITGWDCDIDEIKEVDYTGHDGALVPGPPAAQRFWTTSVSGTGEQTLDWKIESGDWAVVIMNADASSGVSADMRFGALAPARFDLLAWISFAVGAVAMVFGGSSLYVGLRRTGAAGAPGPDDAMTESEPKLEERLSAVPPATGGERRRDR